MSAEPKTKHLTAAYLATPALLLVSTVLIVPLSMLLRYSLNEFDPVNLMIETVTLSNYQRFFTDPYYLGVLMRTISIALIVTVLCLVLGFPLAYAIARSRSRWKSIFVLMTIIPLFIGAPVRALGWMATFTTGGFLDSTISAILPGQRVVLMYSPTAVVVALLSVMLPFMVLTLQGVIESIQRNVEEAAASLGAPPATIFRRILLPLSAPGLIVGSTLVFILCMNAYGTPFLVGGPRFITMGPLLYREFSISGNWPFATAVAFILMSTTLILIVISNVIVRRRYGFS